MGKPEASVPIKPLEQLLSTTRPRIHGWLEILRRDIPSEAGVSRLLGQLKFNYR